MDERQQERVARTLFDARSGRGWTQERLAEAADVSVQTVKRAEGTGVVSLENLRSLCAALELDTERVGQPSTTDGQGIGPLFVRSDEEVWAVVDEGVNLTGFHTAIGLLSVITAMLQFVLLLDGIPAAPSLTDAVFEVVAILVIFVVELPAFGFFALCRLADETPGEAWPRRIARFGAFWLLCANLVGLAIGCIWHPFIGCAVPVLVGGGVFAMQVRRTSELRRLGGVARARFEAEMPGLLARFRQLTSTRDGDTVPRAVALLAEARDLADPAFRWPDIRPLECLVEDLARNISGRRGLNEYIDLAERMALLDGRDSPVRRQAMQAQMRLRRRVNAFAC